ncbi:MAG TPA: 50S ribosomal protein L5 [Candidatus Azoamicus sp. MARI]
MSKLKNLYISTVIPEFINKKISKNIMDVPKITKIVINMGFDHASTTKKQINDIFADLSLISGQRPIITKAKKSIAGFKIREGFELGCKVTLRKKNMYNFLDKLIFLILPRVRDFKGLNIKSFDGKGNYSLGIKEHIIFPEIDYNKVDVIRGMDISIVTNAKNNERGFLLLKTLKFPFK